MAESAEAYRAGKHDGFETTAFEGISQSLEILAQKGTKVIVNGGSLNPAGLAKKIHGLVSLILIYGDHKEADELFYDVR